jgi:hypothetical protein
MIQFKIRDLSWPYSMLVLHKRHRKVSGCSNTLEVDSIYGDRENPRNFRLEEGRVNS